MDFSVKLRASVVEMLEPFTTEDTEFHRGKLRPLRPAQFAERIYDLCRPLVDFILA
jgi:hypothetical protein